MILPQLFMLVVGISGSLGALPQFSWDTLPVFFHSSNTTGLYSKESLKTIAKYSMVTIEKWMGYDDKSMDDEDFMALTMKAVKDINPNVATYFYMNSFKDRPEMTRMARELSQNPDYQLRTENGQLVKNGQGFYAFDLSNPKVRKWWLDICLNATKFSNGDGCFCDSSQHTNVTENDFKPSPSPAKLKAWSEGLLSLTDEVQKALGDDKLLIGKVPLQPYVKAVQIEGFIPNNRSISELLQGLNSGQVIQAHAAHVSCNGDLTDHIAAFLVGASEQNYFGCGSWNAEGNITTPFLWHPEYDKPLGKPTTPPTYQHDTGIWTRKFESGTKVTFDTKKNKGTIEWGKKALNKQAEL